jgi:serine/threonine protein kinase
LLSDRFEALLSDFGLAKYVDEYGFTTPDGLYVKHAPPEVTHTRNFSTAFDIYQAGLTMYRMCLGSNAFNEQYDKYTVNGVLEEELFKQDLVQGVFPHRTSFPMHIPVKLQKVIIKCLEVNPDDRYDAVIDVVNAISLIDECFFDWQYSFANGTRTWSKTTSAGMLHGIEVDSNNSSQAFKLSSKGRRTTTASYTKDKITDRDLIKFFKSVP